jgi:hypothetical protein
VTWNQFKTETESDKIQVNALNGKIDGLGVTSDEQINNLRQQMEYKREEVKRANAEYLDHLKKVQETAYYGRVRRLDSGHTCILIVSCLQSGFHTLAGLLVQLLLASTVCILAEKIRKCADPLSIRRRGSQASS